MIYIFVSVEWQCFIYARILNSSRNLSHNISIIFLRPGLQKSKAWKLISHHKPKFIDLSDYFKKSELGLKQSLRNSKNIINALKGSNYVLPTRKNIVMSDNIYRVHELSLLSILPGSSQIIKLPHGLTEGTILRKLKNFLSQSLRTLLLFHIPRFFMRLPFFMLRSKFIYVTMQGKSTKKNHIISGNLQVQLSIDRLSELRANYKNTKNVLFFGSGAFRYSNKIFDDKLTIDALDYAIKYCYQNDRKLFCKFKKDEDIELIKSIRNYENLIVLDENQNFFDVIKEVQPEYIFCSHNSTLVAELILSDFNLIIYNSGSFKGIESSYFNKYKDCGIKLQDLSSLELVPSLLKSKADKKKLLDLIGCSNVDFNIIDKCI